MSISSFPPTTRRGLLVVVREHIPPSPAPPGHAHAHKQDEDDVLAPSTHEPRKRQPEGANKKEGLWICFAIRPPRGLLLAGR